MISEFHETKLSFNQILPVVRYLKSGKYLTILIPDQPMIFSVEEWYEIQTQVHVDDSKSSYLHWVCVSTMMVPARHGCRTVYTKLLSHFIQSWHWNRQEIR